MCHHLPNIIQEGETASTIHFSAQEFLWVTVCSFIQKTKMSQDHVCLQFLISFLFSESTLALNFLLPSFSSSSLALKSFINVGILLGLAMAKEFNDGGTVGIVLGFST